MKPELRRVITLLALTIFACILNLRSDNVPGLIWNLVLAWIPYALALTILAAGHKKARWWALLPLGMLWLLFFPNAPYLLTSYIHFSGVDFFPGYGRAFAHEPWYDLLIFTSYIWGGVLVGFASLDIVHGVVKKHFGGIAGWGTVIAVCFLSGYAIYLGRFARHNSWDFFRRPWLMFSYVRLSGGAFLFVVVLGIVLSLIYAGVLSFKKRI